MVDVDRVVNSSVLEDDFDEEPVENSNVSLGGFELVGHGEVTNENCGRFSGYYYGCLRVELHNKVTLDGVNCAGKIYAKPYFHSCDKPTCPRCYLFGWVVREARAIENRLKKASKHFGLVEHVIVTFPPKFWHLSVEQLREKAREVLKRRHVVGGSLIFHGFRYNMRKCWYLSPHFHCLGFILGGYGKCRKCPKAHTQECKGCGGFVDRQYRAYETDGCIVKVKGKRISIFWTAYYQLNHATVKMNTTRFHVATWFGNVSYHKMKVTAELRKSVCPICQHDLVKMRYNGKALDVWMLLYTGGFLASLKEDADWVLLEKEVVWEQVVSSGSYEYRRDGDY